MTILAEQSTYGAPQAEVAWLEKALFLAAQELAAFRASATAERERALAALRDVEARLGALETEHSAAARRHAVELERAQSRFEAELAERAKAWSDLGKDVAQRGDNAAIANARLALEIERVAQLGRELADVRAQLKAAVDDREALLGKFATLEEQFAVAAAAARDSQGLAETTRGQLDRMEVELNQSIERCKQLDTESRALATRLNERSEDIESAERAVVRLKQEVGDAQTRILSLERAAAELQVVRPELDRERDMRKVTNEKLDKLQAELDAEKRRNQQAETASFEAKRASDLAQVDVQSARRERDEAKRELEAQRTRIEQAERDLTAARADKSPSEREAEMTREIDGLRKERDEAKREREEAKRELTQNKHELDARTQAELEAARKDRDEARRALDQAKRDAETRVASELESLRKERDDAMRELSEGQSATSLVEQEKDRVAQLKVELDEARAELERTRSERETLRDELALQQKVAAGNEPAKRDQARPAQPTRVEREQQMTVPIPDRAPANDRAPVSEGEADAPSHGRRKREGTAYSVTEVEEEQVFARKGGGGGRGNR